MDAGTFTTGQVANRIIERLVARLQALLASRAAVLVACAVLCLLVIRILWDFSLDLDSREFIGLLESGKLHALELYQWGGPDGETERWIADGFLPWLWIRDSWMVWFRPVASALFSGVHAISGSEPLPYLLTTLLLFCCLVVTISILFRQVMAPVLGGLAVVLFALDDMHSEVVSYVSAMHTCLAAMLGLAGVIAHVRWRKGSKPALWIALGCWLLALLTSEAGLGPLALVLALEAFGVPSRTHRLRAIVPATLLAVGYLIFLRLGHFGAVKMTEYVDPIALPQQYIEGAIKNLPLILGEAVVGEQRAWLAVVVTLAALPFFVAGLRSRSAEQRRGIGAVLLGSFLAVVPALGSTLDLGDYGLRDRMLLMPSIGVAVFWSVALWQAARWSYHSARALPKSFAVLALAGIAGLTLVWSPIVLVRELRLGSVEMRRHDRAAVKFKRGVSKCGPSQQIVWVGAPSSELFPLGWNDAFHRESVLAQGAFSVQRIGEREIRLRLSPPGEPVRPAAAFWRDQVIRYQGSDIRVEDGSHIVVSFDHPSESLCLLALDSRGALNVVPMPAIGEAPRV
jgi:hypothetical protein